MRKFRNELSIEHLLRTSSLKFSIRKNLLKSLLNCRTLDVDNKVLLSYKTRLYSLRTSITRQNTRCLVNGRSRGVAKLLGLSRHSLKKLAARGDVQNLKTRV